MSASDSVSGALDQMFERPGGLYGEMSDIPLIAQMGHDRRVAILDSLDIGDVSGMTCVDFGIGSWGFGSVYNRLQACGSAIGMDISPAALRMSADMVRDTGAQYADRFTTYQSDGSVIPLPDSSVDLFFAGESIEHVKFPPQFLSEVHRVLKPNGQFILTTPNRKAVLFAALGEDYCTSPEHFWLFDYEELKNTVEEYFDIRDAFGFNGSFAPDLDKVVNDPDVAKIWSERFYDEPSLASGIIMHAIKKPDINRRYEVIDIPRSQFQLNNVDTSLDLEFGLTGLLLDQAKTSIRIRRPPSDGLVCRFWGHRWSGKALLSEPASSAEFDLYARDPGWKNWQSSRSTSLDEYVDIFRTGSKNSRSLNEQVIFFEAFTWKIVEI